MTLSNSDHGFGYETNQRNSVALFMIDKYNLFLQLIHFDFDLRPWDLADMVEDSPFSPMVLNGNYISGLEDEISFCCSWLEYLIFVQDPNCCCYVAVWCYLNLSATLLLQQFALCSVLFFFTMYFLV